MSQNKHTGRKFLAPVVYYDIKNLTNNSLTPDVSSGNLSDYTGDESDVEDLGAVASSVLGQIADGHSYTGMGLSTQEIDNMIKPILKPKPI